VKAPAFAYVKPKSLAEAFELLEQPGAKVLAGGQSLIPSLNMRLSSPQLLVDITGLSALRTITLEQAVVRIGALVTHAQLGQSEDIRKHVPLLAAAVPHIAHPAIRNRGTFGGSIALADPAAEYPACLVALNASIVVQGKDGERIVSAESFFKGLFEVDLRPGELVVAAEIRAQLKDERCAFLELARRHGDYAIIGIAAVQSEGNRFVFFGAGSTPVFARNASREPDLGAARAALARELEPPADLYNSSTTKRHLAGVLLERAWNQLTTSP
jgi:carbon-monoxide dehydrogenase medium subunit